MPWSWDFFVSLVVSARSSKSPKPFRDVVPSNSIFVVSSTSMGSKWAIAVRFLFAELFVVFHFIPGSVDTVSTPIFSSPCAFIYFTMALPAESV